MTAKKPPAKRARKTPDQLHKLAQDEPRALVAQLVADGWSAQKISVETKTPLRTVYSWIERADVQEEIERILDARYKVERRYRIRAAEMAWDRIIDILGGKIAPKNPAQAELMGRAMRIFTGEPAPDTAPPLALPEGQQQQQAVMPPGGAMIVQVYTTPPPQPVETVETTATEVDD